MKKPILTLAIVCANIASFCQSILIRPNRIETDYTQYENVFLRSTAIPNLIGVKINGSHANPSATESGNLLLSVEGRGYAGGSFTGIQGAIRFKATQNWNDNNRGTQAEIFTTQNNTTLALSRLFVNHDGKVGIGNYLTTVPDHQLEVQQPNDSDRGIAIYRYGGDAPAIFGIGARGSTITPTPTLQDDILARFGAKGYNGTGYTSSRARIEMVANQNWTDVNNGAKINFYTTENNSINTTNKMTIQGNGNVGIGDDTPSSTLTLNGALELAIETKSFNTNDITFDNLDRNGKSVIRFDGPGTVHLKGIAGGVDGRVVYIMVGRGAELKIYLASSSTNSANKLHFDIGGGFIIDTVQQYRGMTGLMFIYDGIDQAWQLMDRK
ncbi:hypothetical protein [Runella aurantiaca]|uniref:Uncharacterized protein n=1 Tax=Runella aurantiaca TaxID=2282308 RepID=A0A369IB64_9BACT|nr:hypothetical protein [Runella aurantiaca]RDB06878.1 hypothetical protein DVG78_06230 [Runella aurantiaca]